MINIPIQLFIVIFVLCILFCFLYFHLRKQISSAEAAADIYRSAEEENKTLRTEIAALRASNKLFADDNHSLSAKNAQLIRSSDSGSGGVISLSEHSIVCSFYEQHIASLSTKIDQLEKRAASLEQKASSPSPMRKETSHHEEQCAEILRLKSVCDHYYQELISIGPKYTSLQHEFELLKNCRSRSDESLSFLLSVFPSLQSHLDTYISSASDQSKHPSSVSSYLKKEDYQALSKTELLQLALDRYIASHKKTDWQVGRDYELAVGHEFIRAGFRVDFNGISEKYNDLGRDLIAYKGRDTYIVQCKYWGKGKTIQEKHISQLYGTATYYRFLHPLENVHPVFVTNVRFSSTAEKFALHLNVELRALHPLVEFPRIKCNIGHDKDGATTMIYHLPMDPQYDSVKITGVGECYATTVEEAELYGFRHAEKN